jgi:hypothetical protein
MRRINGLAAAAVTLAIAACGDADSQDKSSARGSTGTPASALQSRIPELLEGTWQTAIDSSRLVDAPDDLTQERSVWKLKFLGTGGEDNGPSLFLSNEQVGEIAHSVSLSGGAITLQSHTDCTRFVYVEIDTENVQFRSTEQDRGCPSTFISSVLQGQWRLVESGPSRREPTLAEGSLASREAFVDCALKRDELGIVVGFRDGRGVPEPGQDVGAVEFDSRVSAPHAIPALLEDGGQYVGLREGGGPDVDIFFHGHLPGPDEDQVMVYTPLNSVMDEAGKQGVLSTFMGDYSELAGWQEWATVRLGGSPPGFDEDLVGPRVPRALKHLTPCFRAAIRAANGLLPPRGPVAGVWRTDPITVDDMKRTLRAHGLAKWVGRFAKHAPIRKRPTALVLEIDTRDGFPGYPFDWHLYAEPEAGSRKRMIDYRMQTDRLAAGGQDFPADIPRGPGLRYEQDGDQLVASYEGDSNTYRSAVDGKYLTLTWLKTTYPPHMGIPEEVFQRALYMTAKFKRVG